MCEGEAPRTSGETARRAEATAHQGPEAGPARAYFSSVAGMRPTSS